MSLNIQKKEDNLIKDKHIEPSLFVLHFHWKPLSLAHKRGLNEKVLVRMKGDNVHSSRSSYGHKMTHNTRKKKKTT